MPSNSVRAPQRGHNPLHATRNGAGALTSGTRGVVSRHGPARPSRPRHRWTTNRNSQTTSTKCQYHAAASKPKCCCGVKSPLIGAKQAYGQEYRADDDVKAMKSRRHEEGRTIVQSAEGERRGRHIRSAWNVEKKTPEDDRQPQPLFERISPLRSPWIRAPWCAQSYGRPPNVDCRISACCAHVTVEAEQALRTSSPLSSGHWERPSAPSCPIRLLTSISAAMALQRRRQRHREQRESRTTPRTSRRRT